MLTPNEQLVVNYIEERQSDFHASLMGLCLYRILTKLVPDGDAQNLPEPQVIADIVLESYDDLENGT